MRGHVVEFAGNPRPLHANSEALPLLSLAGER